MTGRGKHVGVRYIFQGCGSGGSYLWVRDAGDDPLHGLVPGGFPEQGGPSDHKKIDAVASGLKLVAPPFGGGGGGVNVGGGFVVGGVLRLEEEEYVRVVLLIMYLCEEVVQSLGTWISKRSW